MFAVRYCTAGVWHTVRFLRAPVARMFYRACLRAMPRHVSAVEWSAAPAAEAQHPGGEAAVQS